MDDVLRNLASDHEIEWRAPQTKRLNDAAAAMGKDPVAGYEYCYTYSATGQPITGDANLPDPTWNFDQLRDGDIIRGSHQYRDSQPPKNSFLLFVIRFSRPIPEGTAPGADIGSVAWEQGPVYVPAT